MHFLKFIVAFCCLIAVGSARPAVPDALNCAISCSGNTLWADYASGSTYTYDFQQAVDISSGLESGKMTTMQVTGKAAVEVHSDCERILTVQLDATKVSASPDEADKMEDREIPAKVKDSLKLPLRFSFEDGRIRSLCPSEGETRASLNMKRGLLSHLNFGIDSVAQRRASVRETDILGDCWTVYENDGTKIKKTKDLSTCVSSFEVFPRLGEKSESSAEWMAVQKGSLSCDIELEDGTERVKVSDCVEKRILSNNMGKNKKGESVEVRSKLTLSETKASVAGSLSAITQRTDLKHQHKSNADCQDAESIFQTGSECLQRKLPADGEASANFKDATKKAIEQLCSETKDQQISGQSAKNLAELIRSLRGISEIGQMKEVFDWVKNGYCAENSLVKASVYAAISQVGTRTSVQLMMAAIKENPDDSSLKSLISNGIGMMQYPTAEIIGDVLEFLQNLDEMIPDNKKSFALAAVTGRYCQLNPNCEEQDQIKQVIAYFSEQIGDNCKNLESTEVMEYESSFYALMAIGNIGRISGGAQVLVGCGNNSALPLAHRAFALRSLRRFPSLSSEEIFDLANMVSSKSLDTELRITAYQIVVRFADRDVRTSEQILVKLAGIFEDDSEDKQVQMYIYSRLKNWLRSKSGSGGSIAKILNNFESKRNRQSSSFGLSTQWKNTYKYPSLKAKLEVEANMIFSGKSVIPRYESLNLTVNTPLLGESINIAEFGIRMEGLEDIMRTILNKFSDKSDSELKRKRRQASFELSDEQKKLLQQEEKPEPRLDIFQRRRGMHYSHTIVDKSMIDFGVMALNLDATSEMKKMGADFLMGGKSDSAAAGTLVESTIVIPTIAGLPILVKKEAYYISDLSMKPSINQDPSGMSADLTLEPRASVFMSRTVSVDAAFDRSGIETSTTILTSTGIKVSAVASYSDASNFEYSFKVDPLKTKQQLIDISTEAVFFNHNGPKSTTRSPVISAPNELEKTCTTSKSLEYFGGKLCVESSFGNAKLSLFYIRRTPGQYRIFLDSHESYDAFEMTLKATNVGNKQEMLFLFGDEANPKWHMKLLAGMELTESERKLNFEFANPLLPIVWASTSQLQGDSRTVSVDLKIGKKDYKFEGKREMMMNEDAKISGEAYQIGMESSKLSLTCVYKSDPESSIGLPKFDLQLTSGENSLGFNYLIQENMLQIAASHKKSGTALTSISNRIMFTDTTFTFDAQVKNKDGPNAAHTLSVTSADNSLLKISHSFKYGAALENSLLDFNAELFLNDGAESSPSLTVKTGNGKLELGTGDAMQTVTLSDIRLVIGNAGDEVDDHKDTRTFSLAYGIEYNGDKSNMKFLVQTLPQEKWGLLNQCLDLVMNVTRTSAAGDVTQHSAQLRHAFNFMRQPKFSQIMSLTFANNVLLDFRHSFRPREAGKMQYDHVLNLESSGRYSVKVQNMYEYLDSKYTLMNTVFLREEKVWEMTQSLLYKPYRAGQPMEIEIIHSSDQQGVKRYLKYSRNMTEASAANENAMMRYLRQKDGQGFSFARFAQLVWRFASQLQISQTVDIQLPVYTQLAETQIDFAQTDGVCYKSTMKTNVGGSEDEYVTTLNCKSSGSSLNDLKRSYRLDLQMNDKSFVAESGIEILAIESGYSATQKLSVSGGGDVLNLTISGTAAKPDAEMVVTGSVDVNFKRSEKELINTQIVLDCKWVDPMQTTNPYLNYSVTVNSKGKQMMEVTYGLKYSKESNDAFIPTKVDSVMTLINGVPSLPFNQFESTVSFQSDETVPMKLEFSNSMDGNNAFSTNVEANEREMKLTVNTVSPYMKNFHFSSSYTPKASGEIAYSIMSGLEINSRILTYEDNGEMYIKGTDGKQLFDMGYSGVSVFTGVDMILNGMQPLYNFSYVGRTAVYSTGEYDVSMKLQENSNGAYDVAVFESKLNQWPMELSALIRTQYKNFGEYSYNVTADSSSDFKSMAAKAEVVNPLGKSGLDMQYKIDSSGEQSTLEAGATLRVVGQTQPLAAAQLSFSGSDILNFNTRSTVTAFGKDNLTLDVGFAPSRQSIVLNRLIDENGKIENKSIGLENNMKVEGDVLSGSLVFYLPTMGVNIVYMTGADHFYKIVGTNNGEVSVMWAVAMINSGKVYPQVTGFSEENVNFGFEYKMGRRAHIHILRSSKDGGSATNWNLKYSVRETNLEATAEMKDNQIVSCSGSIFGQKVEFSNTPDAGYQASIYTPDGSNYMKWKMEAASTSIKVKFQERETCVSYSPKDSGASLNYGSCTNPNVLSYDYSFSGDISTFNGNINIKHTIPEGSSSGPVDTPAFTLNINISDGFKKTNADFNTVDGKTNGVFKYDFTQVSQAGAVKLQVVDFSRTDKIIDFSYNVAEMQFNLSSAMQNRYNFELSTNSLLLEVTNNFEMEASFQRAQTIEDASNAVVINIRYEAEGQKPITLKIWRGEITNGYRYNAKFVMNEIAKTFVADVTDFAIDLPNLKFKLKADIRDEAPDSAINVSSQVELDLQVDDASNYQLIYKELFKNNRATVYDLSSSFKGRVGQIPSAALIDFRDGWLITNMSYALQSDDQLSIVWKTDKVGEIRRSYGLEYNLKNYAIIFSDFTLQFNTPTRHLYLAQSNKDAEDGKEHSILEIFLNKAANEGVTFTATKDFTAENQFNRQLKIELPTRTIGYERELFMQGNKIQYQLVAYWQLPIQPENRIKITFDKDWEPNMAAGYTYSQMVTVEAPFLKNKLIKQMNLVASSDGFIFRGSTSQMPDDAVNMTVAYNRMWDSSKQAYQKSLNVSFVQMKNDITADLQIVSESEKLSRSSVYSPWKYLTEYKIFAQIPSQNIDSFVKIRSVPFEELSLATQDGATFSMRYYNKYMKSRFSIFVSNGNREAGQLTVVTDGRQLTWKATLDTGSGYMNPESSLSIPFYEPSKVLIAASAGISKCGTKLHIGGITGEFSGKIPSLWKPDKLPAGSNFFFAGVKLRKDNTISYMSHWRVSALNTAASVLMKQTLIDSWAVADDLPIGTDPLNQLIRGIVQSQASNMDTASVMNILMEISSNDIDKLSKWAEAARSRNDLFCNSIASVVASVYNVFAMMVQQSMAAMQSVSAENWLPSTDSIADAINRVADVIASSLSFTPLIEAWSEFVGFARAAFTNAAGAVTYLLDMMSASLSSSITEATGGAGSNMYALLNQMLSSVTPLNDLITGTQQAVAIVIKALSAARAELLTQLGEMLQPYALRHLGDLNEFVEFGDNIQRETVIWGASTDSGPSGEAEATLPRMLASMLYEENQIPYMMNVFETINLIMSGQLSNAMRQFVRADKLKVTKWDIKSPVLCTDDTCGYSQISGEAYLPVYMKNFRSSRASSYSTQSASSLYQAASYVMLPMREVEELLRISHATGVVTDSSITTFDGAKFDATKPCKYLLAHDFMKNEFSILQSYTSNPTGTNRGDLNIKFYETVLTLSPALELKVDSEVTDPEGTIKISDGDEERQVVMSRDGDEVVLQFNTALKNAVIVRCSTWKCSFKVSRLYHSRVQGALGSSDSIAGNDIYGNDERRHQQLWSSECAA